MKKRWIPQERRTGIMITSSILCPARLLPSCTGTLVFHSRKCTKKWTSSCNWSSILQWKEWKNVKTKKKLMSQVSKLHLQAFPNETDVGPALESYCNVRLGRGMHVLEQELTKSNRKTFHRWVHIGNSLKERNERLTGWKKENQETNGSL